MESMKTWFTSDQHFGHMNIIEYCNRPYSSIDEMGLDVVERYNRLVAPDDEVWFLGDVCMGKLAESLEYVGMMNGTKRLVPGNHDRMFGTRGTKYKNAADRYIEAGFSEIIDGPVWLGDDLILSHFPYAGESDDQREDRFEEYRPPKDRRRLLHGHTHGAWLKSGNQIDVGVDAWGGYPVELEEVMTLLNGGRESIDPMPWKP